MSGMDDSEAQNSNQDWDEPMSPSPPDHSNCDGPASPDPMSPDNEGFNNRPRTPDDPMSPDDFGGAEPMSPDNDPRNHNQRGSPAQEYPMSPENGVCSEGLPEDPSQLRGPSTPNDPASPIDPRSPDDFARYDDPRSPDDFESRDGPRSPDSPTSPEGHRADGPASPDGPRSPDEHGGFDGPRTIGYQDGPLSPDNHSSLEGKRSSVEPPSLNDSTSVDGSRTLDGQSSTGGLGTPDCGVSSHDAMTLDSVERRDQITPDDPASLTGFTESQSMKSPSLSNPRSPVDLDGQTNDGQDDRLSEISEGDSALNGELENEEEEEEKNQDTESANKAKRRSDDSLGLRDELDFEAERESGEEDGEEGEEGEEGESPKKVRDVENREEGELSDEEEDDALLRQEPKTVCRFFNKGQCTWGTNCRFLHPGVSDKGNYNMFAPSSKQQATAEKEEETTERERPREVRRFIPEPSPFESAWERGLRNAREMMKRANKRKETDADFEEKRFNLSLGQAELDRENDYYTRPASPVYKQPDEITDQYLDPYEKQAIRHFRGGHFENFEVRYHVDPRYNMREGGQDRSRREKYEREVSERTNRRSRHGPPGEERSRIWQDDRYMDVMPSGEGRAAGAPRGEAEAWADPWARRKTPPRHGRKKKTSRTRSYSTGSSSRSSSRSSRSSSYSSKSRSKSAGSKSSRSSAGSRSSRSRSSSHSPSPGRRRGNPRSRMGEKPHMRSFGGRGGRLPPTGPHSRPPIPRRPNEPRDPRMLNIPRRPDSKSSRMDHKDRMLNIPRRPEAKTNRMDDKNRMPNVHWRPEAKFKRNDDYERMLNIPRRPDNKFNKMDNSDRMLNIPRRPENKSSKESSDRMLNIPRRPESKSNKMDAVDRMLNIPRRPEVKQNKMDAKDRLSSPPPPPSLRQEIKPKITSGKRIVQPPIDVKPPKVPLRERLDKFGRIRKEIARNLSRSRSRSRSRGRAGRKFSSSRSRSRSGSRSSSATSRSRSPVTRVRGRSVSRSRSRSSSSHSSSASSIGSPRRKLGAKRKVAQGTVSYGQAKSKAMDPMKLSGQKQQIKLTLKGPAMRRLDKPVLPQEDDSGESDTGGKIGKRKPDSPPPEPPPAKMVARSPPPVAALPPQVKKPQANRREELLKQLRAVEDAIARKRTKLPT